MAMVEDKKIFSSPYFKHSKDALQRIVSLTNLDCLSTTFGCSHRDYWLYKTSDFPDAVRNFSSNVFAIASKHPYFEESEKIFFSNLARGSILFWASIQHKDGSFDEFYPYERGWVGPTAFTLYSNVEAYKKISNLLSNRDKDRVLDSFIKAAGYISAGDKEGDDLANHHAMAYLALIKVFEIIQRKEIKKKAFECLENYLKYHIKDEGWSIEYDGIDPGYLSASCSFLAKTLEVEYREDIVDIIKSYSKNLSIFCYPDGCFAGPIGSRNTMHLYPYAFELLAKKDKNINYLAAFSQFSLESGNCITPNVMSDRYVHYRVEEYLITDKLFLDNTADIKNEFQISNKEIVLPKGGIYHFNNEENFLTINLAKNLVIDCYFKKGLDYNWERFSFTGIRILDKKGLFTSQFISKSNNFKLNRKSVLVEGYLAKISTENSFNIFKNIIFRIILIFCSKSTFASNFLKKNIRRLLMFSRAKNYYYFKMSLDLQTMELEIYIKRGINAKAKNIQFGTAISDRYVPQSRFSRESDHKLDSEIIDGFTKNQLINSLNKNGFLSHKIKLL